jgi:hypothetical protein
VEVRGRGRSSDRPFLPSASLRQVDNGLRELLLQLSPSARDNLRRVLILDQPDRDAISSELLRYGDANGDGWAEVIDTLSDMPGRSAQGCPTAGGDGRSGIAPVPVPRWSRGVPGNVGMRWGLSGKKDARWAGVSHHRGRSRIRPWAPCQGGGRGFESRRPLQVTGASGSGRESPGDTPGAAGHSRLDR